MQEHAEEDIIKGCKRNDRFFQELLYKKYYSEFLKVCARYAKNREDAEQLLQDSFLKIFLHIGDYAFKGSFEGWMRRIVVNTSLDYLKSKYVKDAAMVASVKELSDYPSISVPEEAVDKMALKDLLVLIQALPPASRAVFNLFIFEGYNHKEIARIMDISEGTSQWHVNNARRNLQKKILKRQQEVVSGIKDLRYEQK